MKDPNLAILNAYKTALAGMSFSGVDVPVYSKTAPLEPIPAKYVLLSTQSKTQNKTKCGIWWECNIMVAIVSRYPNGTGDLTFSMVVGKEVSARVQTSVPTLTDFNIRQVKQLPTTEVFLETDTENVFQYIMNFYNKINRAA